MPSVTIRFYEELNDFLPENRRKQPSVVECASGCTAKAIIEDMGVPHTEVDLILAQGRSVGFEYRLRDGDVLSVYPVFESWDMSGLSLVRALPLREPRFVLDVHLGKLARLLRMLGFDARYENDSSDEELVLTARNEKRIILTRDRGLLKRRTVTHGYLLRSLVPREQLAEVLRRFDLGGRIHMFSLCIVCNVPILRVDKASVVALLPPVVAASYADFSRCPRCRRVFWRGTHWESMKKLAAEVLAGTTGSQSES
jgi:uncharacterized protein with PIN domain